ncbi:unnamed protein product, partial [Owenia fusiformis]
TIVEKTDINSTINGYPIIPYSKIRKWRSCSANAQKLCSLNHGRSATSFNKTKKESSIPLEERITVVVKTINSRGSLVIRMIRSLWEFYNKMKVIIVGETNPNFHPGNDLYDFIMENQQYLVYIQVTVDSGISYGRNVGVNAASTDLIFLIDDDVMFTNETDLRKMVNIIDTSDISLVAGVYHLGLTGIFHILKSRLYIFKYTFYEKLPYFEHCYRTDITQNVFLAKREDLIKTDMWRPDQKILEHLDFFLTLRKHGLKVASCLDINLKHDRLATGSTKTRSKTEIFKYRGMYQFNWGLEGWYTSCNPSHYHDPINVLETFCQKLIH